MTSTVRAAQIKLRISAADAERASELRRLAEQFFLRGVLDALEIALHERFGATAVIRIRRLPLRWKLSETELVDHAVHRRLAGELADAVAEDVRAADGAWLLGNPHAAKRASARPATNAQIAVFASPAHELAVAIADLASGREPAFYHPKPDRAELWADVASAGAACARDVIEWLEVFAAHDAIAQAPARVRELAGLPARRSAAQIAARCSGPPSGEAAAARRGLAGRATPRHRDPIPGPVLAEGSSPSGATDEWLPESPPRSQRAPDTLATGAAASLVGEESESSASVDTSLATPLAGAFYLLARVVELDLAEHLWCAGIVEGPMIAAALRGLAPLELADDPVFDVIAGSRDAGEPAAPWAVEEVRAKTRDTLGRLLARRGVALDRDALDMRLDGLASGLRGEPLARYSAAAIVMLVSARLAREPSLEHARAILLRPGTIGIAAGEIRVEIPLATVDVDLRRAGLDFDPGWIPWLSCHVRIVHVAGEADVL